MTFGIKLDNLLVIVREVLFRFGFRMSKKKIGNATQIDSPLLFKILRKIVY